MHVGQRIRERRKKLGITADELATKLGKDRSTIFRYEKGDIENLPADTLEPIAQILRTTPQFLMGWEDFGKKNDTITDIVLRMRNDDVFLSVVESLYEMDEEKLSGLLTLLK